MQVDEKQLIHAVNESVKELQHLLDSHCRLVAAVLEGRFESADPRCFFSDSDFCTPRTRELKLKHAIEEAIEVLEQSRKSFKSKQLEALRKKLMQTLIDME